MQHSLTCFSVLCMFSAAAQTTHEMLVKDDAFDPPFLTIQLGDHVHISWDATDTLEHSFAQVEQATWEVNGTTPLNGGFHLGEGSPMPGTDFTITPTSDVWYVCPFRAAMGMKGMINVQGGVGMEETTGPHEVRFAPNPASSRTNVVAPEGWPISVRILDGTGVLQTWQQLGAGRTVDLTGLPPGLYMAEVWYTEGPLLGRRRLLLER
jgi:plastocyanin